MPRSEEKRMFYPERMAKVTIAAPKAHMQEIINTLYRLKALHIEEYVPRKQGDLGIGAPSKDADRISELLLIIQAIKRQIFLDHAGSKKVAWNIRKIDGFLRKLRNDVDSLNNRIKETGDRIKEQEKTIEEYSFLERCGIADSRILGEYRTLAMVSGFAENPGALEGEGAALFCGRGEKPSPFVMFVRKDRREALDAALAKARCTDVKLRIKPSGSVKEGLANAQQELTSLKEKKASLLGELESVGSEYGGLLAGVEEKLLSMVERSEAPLKFAASEYVFIIQGWVPAKHTAQLLEKLPNISPSIYIKVDEAKEGPTKMENPKAVQPFEFFLNLYSLPKYDEIDPSFLMFITFPLFYGMMLGDIGYGLVLLALALALRFRSGRMRALVDITILSALATIAFGFVFGEAFGQEELLGAQLHPYVHRLHEVKELILASVVLGVVHINTGFLLGFINERRRHGLAKAVMAKLSWIGIQASLMLLLLNYANVVSVGMSIPAALFVLSVGALLKGEGMVGIIEIPSLIGNILSYLRLAAIGLASASVAMVVNAMAGGLFAGGGIGVVLGVVVLLLGHTINLALGILDGFLQSLRLHYVEMFTKFYHGSGKPYRPFGSK
ncbi:MAG: V-type ATP synthase subunit I [Candidatus Aenigmarchaeota archaeon]|nr:V-type ATP synthase subunit I [Candidatus Aenigmarchaeota archaeon]